MTMGKMKNWSAATKTKKQLEKQVVGSTVFTDNLNNNNNLKIYYNNHQNSSKKPFKMEVVDF